MKTCFALIVLFIVGCAKDRPCPVCHGQMGIVYAATTRMDCHGQVVASCWLCEACPRCNKCAAKITEADVAPIGTEPKGFEDPVRYGWRVTKKAHYRNPRDD